MLIASVQSCTALPQVHKTGPSARPQDPQFLRTQYKSSLKTTGYNLSKCSKLFGLHSGTNVPSRKGYRLHLAFPYRCLTRSSTGMEVKEIGTQEKKDSKEYGYKQTLFTAEKCNVSIGNG